MDQVPEEFDTPEVNKDCNYPACGCPHFMC